jgi:hypothetical protein
VLIGIPSANLRKVFEEKHGSNQNAHRRFHSRYLGEPECSQSFAKFLLTSTDEVAVPLEGLVDFAKRRNGWSERRRSSRAKRRSCKPNWPTLISRHAPRLKRCNKLKIAFRKSSFKSRPWTN